MTTKASRKIMRGMLLMEQMYPVLAPHITNHNSMTAEQRLVTAATVAHLTLLSGPMRLPVDIRVLEAVSDAVKGVDP